MVTISIMTTRYGLAEQPPSLLAGAGAGPASLSLAHRADLFVAPAALPRAF
jgi:hypothetical protein